MTTQVQIRGNTQATQEARTLASRELDINTTDGRIAVHDGSTAGGVRHVNYKDQQNQEFVYASASGTDTITMSCAVAPSGYQAGQRFVFKAAATNTGAATLNVDSLGAKTIKKISGGSLVDVEAGDIVSGGVYTCMYDGTYMQVSGGAVGGSGGDTIVYSATAASDASLGNTGIFSAGNSYEIELTNFTPTNDFTLLELEFHDGTSYVNSGGDYDTDIPDQTIEGGALLYERDTQSSTSAAQLSKSVGSAANEALSGLITIYDPAVGGEWVRYTFHISSTDPTGRVEQIFGAGQVDGSTTAMTGFRIKWDSGNIESGKICVREKPLS